MYYSGGLADLAGNAYPVTCEDVPPPKCWNELTEQPAPKYQFLTLLETEDVAECTSFLEASHYS